MQLKLDILPSEQAKLYPFLQQITDLGFMLFAGTAIALQLGHRQSVDFDFFHEQDISRLQFNLLHLEGLESHYVLQNTPDTLFEDGDLNLLTKKEKRFLEHMAIKVGRNLGKEKK